MLVFRDFPGSSTFCTCVCAWQIVTLTWLPQLLVMKIVDPGYTFHLHCMYYPGTAAGIFLAYPHGIKENWIYSTNGFQAAETKIINKHMAAT